MNKKTTFALTAALSLSFLTVAALAQETMPASTDGMKHDDMMKGYQPYTKADYDKASGMQRVLFFHATWCPKCKAADADIMKNLAQLPKNTVVFKVDYDKEVALKKQYGIGMQHSFVLVDAKGKVLKKWAGGGMKEIAMNTSKGM